MAAKSPQAALLTVLLMAPILGGCSDTTFSSTVFNPLNLDLPFLPYREPVRIGIVHKGQGIFDPHTWLEQSFGSPWQTFRRRLSLELNAPVQIVDLKPFQVAAHLQSGRLDFAFLSAKDYLDLCEEFGEPGQVLAISEVAVRQGLIVSNVDSEIKSMSEIRGQQFAFGPKGDPVLDLAAKKALEDAGVPISEINRGLLDQPLLFTNHISSHEVAIQIASGLGAQVGVVEKSEFNAYPRTGGNLLLRQVSKDRFSILGETEIVRMDTIPEGPFLASKNADAKTIEQVSHFLLTNKNHVESFSSMGLAGFHSPNSDVMNELRKLKETSAQSESQPRPARSSATTDKP